MVLNALCREQNRWSFVLSILVMFCILTSAFLSPFPSSKISIYESQGALKSRRSYPTFFLSPEILPRKWYNGTKRSKSKRESVRNNHSNKFRKMREEEKVDQQYQMYKKISSSEKLSKRREWTESMCRHIFMGYILGTNVASSKDLENFNKNIASGKRDSNPLINLKSINRVNAAELEASYKTNKGISTCAVGWEQDTAVSHLLDKSTGKDIYLIGTAHISNASAVLVKDVISAVKPTQVMIELDESRIRRMGSPKSTSVQNENNQQNTQKEKSGDKEIPSSIGESYRAPTTEEKKQAKSEFLQGKCKRNDQDAKLSGSACWSWCCCFGQCYSCLIQHVR